MPRALRRRRPPESALEDDGDMIEGDATLGAEVGSFEIDDSASRCDDDEDVDDDEDNEHEDDDDGFGNCRDAARLSSVQIR